MFEQAFKNIDDILHETRGGSVTLPEATRPGCSPRAWG